MKIKRFFAKDMRAALAEVKEILGPDAVIMSNKRVSGGIEIIAAIDNEQAEPSLAAEQSSNSESFSTAIEPFFAIAEDTVSLGTALANTNLAMKSEFHAEHGPADPNDDLRSLLERQQAFRQQQNEVPSSSPVASAPALPSWAQQTFDQSQSASVKPLSPMAPQDTVAAKEEFDAIKAEMASIRLLLKHQVSNLMQQELARTEPVRAMLNEQLRDAGFHQEVSEHFIQLIPTELSPHEAIAALPDLLVSQLSCGNESMLNDGGLIALVGPTGVGKTTTVAKLAARFIARYGINQVALITTDNYRIGAQEQLATFGKIMGCPVRNAATVEELETVIYQLRSRRLILIDTAGMSQRDMRLVEQLKQLTQSTRLPIQPYLVLSATAQYRVLKETVERFKQIDLVGCILTKLDEAHTIGEVLSILIQHNLPVCYLADGQRVPEDLRMADPHFLAKRALTEDPTGDSPMSAQGNIAGLYE